MLIVLLLVPRIVTALPNVIQPTYRDTTIIAYASPITPRSLVGSLIGKEGKEYLLGQSGIPRADWEDVDFIVTKESGWHPSIVNKSSGACGLMQFLPCSKEKAGENWNDPVEALKRGDKYVHSSYGSWKQARLFWVLHNWY